ncbi:hypothetical protein PHJA_002159200 [Phtheirospermum japonicum]|uniref:Uncharacterized protein n=1 Tax=Phtheirospermum japonicum TaxID=374723 RepID=A0A830D1C1_9LAMI|nr:hypothetical protein PHJA_002159200 [Phtheirospermum japonicum]
MAAVRGFTMSFSVKLLRRVDLSGGKNGLVLEVRRKKQRLSTDGELVKCCCSEIRGVCGSGRSDEKCDELMFDPNKRPDYWVPIRPFRFSAPDTPIADRIIPSRYRQSPNTLSRSSSDDVSV